MADALSTSPTATDNGDDNNLDRGSAASPHSADAHVAALATRPGLAQPRPPVSVEQFFDTVLLDLIPRNAWSTEGSVDPGPARPRWVVHDRMSAANCARFCRWARILLAETNCAAVPGDGAQMIFDWYAEASFRSEKDVEAAMKQVLLPIVRDAAKKLRDAVFSEPDSQAKLALGTFFGPECWPEMNEELLFTTTHGAEANMCAVVREADDGVLLALFECTTFGVDADRYELLHPPKQSRGGVFPLNDDSVDAKYDHLFTRCYSQMLANACPRAAFSTANINIYCYVDLEQDPDILFYFTVRHGLDGGSIPLSLIFFFNMCRQSRVIMPSDACKRNARLALARNRTST